MRFGADYDFSAKIALNTSLEHARRNLSGIQLAVDGSDRTSTLRLGARWLPTRATQVGCDLSREQRSISSGSAVTIGNPYGNTGLSCYGQFVLQ